MTKQELYFNANRLGYNVAFMILNIANQGYV